MLTTLLELAGLALLAIAALLLISPGAAVLVAGISCLFLSWSITRHP